MGSTAATTASRPDAHHLVRLVLTRFDVGEVLEVNDLTAGLMNRNWWVQTTTGSFALKQVLDVGPDEARRQHRITRALAADSFPVPVPLVGRDGATLVDIDGGHYMLLPWVDGDHYRGRDLILDSCRALGELLARVHLWLRSNADALGLEPPPASREMAATPPEAAAETIGRFLDLATRRPVPDEFDRVVQDRLAERQELLEQHARLWPGTRVVSPIGWTHGDFHALNIIWSPDYPGPTGHVAAILDWDRIRPQPVAWELARSATLLFGYDRGGSNWVLDLERVAAFTTGYRRISPLTDDQVAEAVHLLWWARLSGDLWMLERRYDHDDPTADHLFLSGSSLLPWWTAHRDDVTTAFTQPPQR